MKLFEAKIAANKTARKQFFLFAGESMYPDGGAEDFITTLDSIEECIAIVKALKEEQKEGSPNYISWAHALDTTTNTLIGIDLSPSPKYGTTFKLRSK